MSALVAASGGSDYLTFFHLLFQLSDGNLTPARRTRLVSLSGGCFSDFVEGCYPLSKWRYRGASRDDRWSLSHFTFSTHKHSIGMKVNPTTFSIQLVPLAYFPGQSFGSRDGRKSLNLKNPPTS